MTNTHINVGGHKITTNKVGQVHTVTSFDSTYTFGGGTYANLEVYQNGAAAFTLYFTQANAFTPKFHYIAIGRWK